MSVPKIHRPAPLLQRGFTMLELMVASAIALFMLIGVSELYLSSLAGEKTNSAASDITANGRYAIEVLRRELLHAGYRGVTWAEPSAVTTIGTVTDECIGSGFVTNLRQGVWGANDSNPFSATCIPSTAYSIGDVLVVRHAGLAAVATGSLASSTIYFRSAYERGEVFKGSNSSTLATTFTQTPNFNYPLEVRAFYVSKYTDSASENPNMPSLYKVSLGTGPAMTAELVASNVENMQVQYGRYTTDLNTRFYNADGVSPTADATTTTPTEWDDVSVVRVWLLVRGTKVEPGYTNTSTYTLGDKTIIVNDGYRREVFSTVVKLRNI